MRRSPLARVVPLRRVTPLDRGSRPPARRWSGELAVRATAEERAALRGALLRRCASHCEACGYRLDLTCWDAHHRLPRGRGGRDDLCTLVALHPRCHTVGPWSVHMRPAWGYERGLLVRSGLQPADVPLTLASRRQVLLTAAGDYQAVA